MNYSSNIAYKACLLYLSYRGLIAGYLLSDKYEECNLEVKLNIYTLMYKPQ